MFMSENKKKSSEPSAIKRASNFDKAISKNAKDNLKDVFGDVFEDFTFLDTGGGKIDALKTLVPGTWWIEDKPKNAFDGAVLGLASILLDLPHNSSYTINKQMNFQRANNWKHIYDIIKEKHYGNS